MLPTMRQFARVGVRSAHGAICRSYAPRTLGQMMQRQGGVSTQFNRIFSSDADAEKKDTIMGDVNFLIDCASKGFDMEEMARRIGKVDNPDACLRRLQVGNARFYLGQAEQKDVDAMSRRAQIVSQAPFAVILGCSDSRVPVEILFDAGFGDLFVVRVAGNVASDSTLGTIQYATEHLGTPLIVVLGHEGCGAVLASMHPDSLGGEPPAIQKLLKNITPSTTRPHIRRILDQKAKIREAVTGNVLSQVRELFQDPTLKARVDAGQLKIVGGYYSIQSGIVDFMNVTPDDLAAVQTVVDADAKEEQK